jgi:hypothetical protein
VGATVFYILAVGITAPAVLADTSAQTTTGAANASVELAVTTAALEERSGTVGGNTASLVDASVGGLDPLSSGGVVTLSADTPIVSSRSFGATGFPVAALAAACMGLCWLGRTRAKTN